MVEKFSRVRLDEEVELLGDLLHKILRYCPEVRIGIAGGH
jgi:hypothetical protein